MHNRTYDRSNVLHNRICIGLNVLYGEMALFVSRIVIFVLSKRPFFLNRFAKTGFNIKGVLTPFQFFRSVYIITSKSSWNWPVSVLLWCVAAAHLNRRRI